MPGWRGGQEVGPERGVSRKGGAGAEEGAAMEQGQGWGTEFGGGRRWGQ